MGNQHDDRVVRFINVNGNVNGIHAALTVDGGAQAGVDQLTIDDTGDDTDNTGNLTATRVTGLGMTNGQIDYAAFEDLHINLGSGSDTFTVESTHAGPASTTTVEGRGGHDTLNVRTIDGPTTIAGDGVALKLTFGTNTLLTGTGNDVINVGSAAE